MLNYILLELMKKAILSIMLIASLGTAQVSLGASAPKHRYQPSTEQADKQAVEAYSDTTSVDSANYDDGNEESGSRASHSMYSLENYDDPFDFFGSVFGKGTLMFIIVLTVILCLLFIFAPLIIIFLIIRYLMRRHNDKVKLAEMAMEKGGYVPEKQRPIDRQSNDYLVKSGIRNTFLGLGLTAMFLVMGTGFLAGIGALIMFMGMGQVVIGSLPAIKKWWNNRQDNHSSLV